MDCEFQYDPVEETITEPHVLLHCSTGRVPHLTVKKGEYWPKVRGEKLEPYQIYIHHGVLHWCTDREGNRFDESTSIPIFAHYYNYKPFGAIPINEQLLDQETQLFKDVTSLVGHEPFKSHLKKSAEKIINEYEVEVLKMQPRLGMET